MSPRGRKAILALTVLIALGIVFVTAVKVHSTWLLPKAPVNWNKSQLAKIDKRKIGTTDKPRDSFSFAVLGDNKNSIQTFDRIIKKLNQDDVLFAIATGDLVFDGEEIKYRLFLNQVKGLKMPILTALGNHDTEADGRANYERIFGDRYYSFTVANNYFILLDDADKKIDAGQMKWFKEELGKSMSYDHRFVFMHVPPFRGKRNWRMPMTQFLKDRKLADEIKRLCMDYDVNYVFGSHLHTFDIDMWPEKIHYIITGGAGAELWDVDSYRDFNHYIKVTLRGYYPIDFDTVKINSPGQSIIYQYIEEPWVYTYAFTANKYATLMLILGPVFLVLLGLFLVGGRGLRISRKEP